MTTALPLLFLNHADVIAAGGNDIAAACRDVRMALAQLRAGEAEMPPEVSVRLGLPGTDQARAYALPARTGAVAAVKWTAHQPPAAPSITLLNDAISGLPTGVVESATLTSTRTAAVSALVLQHAASAPLRKIALLGAGAQARAHLHMLATLFPSLTAVTLWNRTAARADTLATQLGPTAPWPLTTTQDLPASLKDADAIVTCTNAPTPFLGPDAIRPGRLLLQIGYHEVTFDAIDRADIILVDLWGEFRLTSAKSLFQMHRAGRFPETRVSANLAQLALDGYTPPPNASVYFSSFGLNIFDIAIAARVLRDAAHLGIGTRLAL